MRLGLDTTPVLSGDTGVALYARRLHDELPGVAPDIEVVPFGAGRGPAPPFPMRRVRLPLRIVHRTWPLVRWPSVERIIGPVDVVHALDGVPPPTRSPLVMTVHDLLPLVIPEYYGPRFIRVATQHAQALKRATVVVADCHATAQTVSELISVPLDRIVVAPLGHRTPSPVVPPPRFDPPYILAVGSITPRKGFQFLIEAAARAGPDIPPIVVAGPPGWRAEEVQGVVPRLAMEGRVTFLGRVSDEELEALYRRASLVCHPSVAEGFGIPCLEGMGYGVPVVAGDIPSVREIGAGAVELVPTADVDALAAALERVLTDGHLRAGMTAAGLARAKEYSWSAMAAQVAAAYRSAVA